MTASLVPLSAHPNALILKPGTFTPDVTATAMVYEYVAPPATPSTPVTVYTDATGTTTLSTASSPQPIPVDSNGLLVGYVAAGQDLAVVASQGGVTAPPAFVAPLRASSVVSDSSSDLLSPIVATLANRHRALRDVLSVMDYGAKGDGVTDDTIAVNECLADAASRVTSYGRCAVVLPHGRAFQLGQLSVASGIQIHAHGAVVNSLTNWSTGSGMLDWTVTTLSDFAVLGGLWVGTGSEQSVQNLFYSRSNRNVQDIRFEGMKLVNWGAGAFYMRNPTRAFVIGNTLINTGASAVGNAHGNAINFVADGSQTFGGGLFAIGNYVESASAAIAFVNTSTWAGGSVNFVVIGNRCVGVNTNANNNCGAITACENDTTSAITASDFIVLGNHVTNPVTDASSGALVIGGGSQAGSAVSRFQVAFNNLITTSTSSGAFLKGTSLDGELVNNRITAPSATNGPIHDQSTGTNAVTKSGNRFTAAVKQGRATLVAGTVTVSTAEIQAGDNVHLSVVSAGGTRGIVQLGTITAGTSFVINSVQPGTASTLQTSDTSTVFWKIEH